MKYNNYVSLCFWKKFLVPFSQNKKYLVVIAIETLFYWLQWGIYSLIIKDALNAVTYGDKNWFIIVVCIIAFLMILNTIPNHFYRKNKEKLFRWMQEFLYNTYITKYFQLSNNITDSKWTGYFNNVIQRWGDNWSWLLSFWITSWLEVSITLITAIVLVVIYTNRIWWLFVGILFFFSFSIAQYGNNKMIPLRKEMREYFTEADKNIIRLIMSKFEVISNNRINSEVNKLWWIFDNILTRKIQESYLKIFTIDIQRGALQFANILLFIYIWFWVLEWKFEVWLLAMIWLLSNQIQRSTRELNNFISDFYSRIIYVEKLREMFDDAPMIQWYDEGKEFIYKKWDVVLDKIRYDYGKWEVFNDFSLKISWGQKIALVWISGWGKTTLMKLIAGYIHPQSGTISVDKQKLPNGQSNDFVSLKSYYQHIGYLTQEPSVFDGSVYDNLVYALNYEPTQHQIEKVLSDAQCQFVLDFPDGLESQIGEKGIRLSGWQRQRLAIAKIMLKKPNIILLDEPTSALDSFSEEEVTKAFDNLSRWKTVIIIAHRLQTVKQADTILVLDQGQIIEQGTHTELVKKKWSYAKMLELQSGF